MDPSQTSAAARELHKRHFGTLPTHIVRAPAAVELLGACAAVPDSLCLSAAFDRFVSIAASPRADGKIELVSSTFPQPERFAADRLEKRPEAAWAHLPKSMLSECRRRNIHYSGFNAAIVDEIPAGAGLGRFSALQVATALTIRQLWPFRLSHLGGLATAPTRRPSGELSAMEPLEKVALARLCQDAQKQFLGIESSLAEPLACLFGRSWHVLGIDLRFTTIDALPLIGCVFVLCRLPHGARPAPATRATCDAATRRLGVKSLRSLEIRDLPGLRKKLPDGEYHAVVHVVGEIARVVAAERALQNEDAAQFGAFLSQSHESLLQLEPAPPELVSLVDLASKHAACMGARIVGQSVLCCVPHHQAAGFVAALQESLPAVETMVLQTADAPAGS